MEAWLWHDLIEEGKELMVEEEQIHLEDLDDALEPYLFDDPEFAGIVREFLNKSAELERLIDPCKDCVKSWWISRQLPFYEQDIEYPLQTNPYEVFAILESENQEMFTAAKAMILDRVKRQIESDSEDVRVKSMLKSGFANLGKIQGAACESTNLSGGQNAQGTKAGIIQQLIDSTQREIKSMGETA